MSCTICHCSLRPNCCKYCSATVTLAACECLGRLVDQLTALGGRSALQSLEIHLHKFSLPAAAHSSFNQSLMVLIGQHRQSLQELKVARNVERTYGGLAGGISAAIALRICPQLRAISLCDQAATVVDDICTIEGDLGHVRTVTLGTDAGGQMAEFDTICALLRRLTGIKMVRRRDIQFEKYHFAVGLLHSV